VIRWTDYMLETQSFEREARLMIQEAEQLREEARLEDYVKIREQERRLRELEIQQELSRYREEIRNLYENAKELFDNREYKEAVVVLDKILREDPYNEQVARLKQIATNLDQGKRDRNAWEEFNRNWKERSPCGWSAAKPWSAARFSTSPARRSTLRIRPNKWKRSRGLRPTRFAVWRDRSPPIPKRRRSFSEWVPTSSSTAT